MTTPTAHPYCRISDPTQRKGGGLERQTTADTQEFCRLFSFGLSKRILIDDGVSAFKGLNASPEHQLGQFLAEARRGLIPPGDCLLLENYDRLSRQDPWAAISLVNDLRQLGIHIGRLDRMKLLRADSTDAGDFFEAAIELMRGNSESAAKSTRNGAEWKKKRAAARSEILTSAVPAWIEVVGRYRDGSKMRGGTFRLIPDRAATVKHIFQLAASGYGYQAIVKRLNEENVPPFGACEIVKDKDGKPVLHKKEGKRKGKPKLRAVKGSRYGSGRWTLPYIARLVNDKRAMGEFQPCGKGRKPEGPAIADYYPAVITGDEFWAAQGAADTRRKNSKSGKGVRQHRVGKYINLFTSIVNARDSRPYVAASKPTRGPAGRTYHRVLIAQASQEGRGPSLSFPLAVFEQAVLSCLKEIDPHSILNGDHGPDETLTLAAELSNVETRIAELETELLNGNVAALSRVLRSLEDRQKELTTKLAEARQRALHPLSESWGDAQSLVEALETASDPTDARLRLRAALRRIVDAIFVLVVPRGRDRLAAVQIDFAKSGTAEGRRRSYLIHYRAAGNRRPGGWSVESFASSDGGEYDLRAAGDVRALSSHLENLDFSRN